MQAKAVVGPARFVDGTHTAARDVWGLGKVLEANAVWLRTAGLREFCQMSMLPVHVTSQQTQHLHKLSWCAEFPPRASRGPQNTQTTASCFSLKTPAIAWVDNFGTCSSVDKVVFGQGTNSGQVQESPHTQSPPCWNGLCSSVVWSDIPFLLLCLWI